MEKTLKNFNCLFLTVFCFYFGCILFSPPLKKINGTGPIWFTDKSFECPMIINIKSRSRTHTELRNICMVGSNSIEFFKFNAIRTNHANIS